MIFASFQSSHSSALAANHDQKIDKFFKSVPGVSALQQALRLLATFRLAGLAAKPWQRKRFQFLVWSAPLEHIHKLFNGLEKVRCFRIRRLFPRIN
jgi:hypothetical protein